jgi:hypothetical protein
MKLELIAAKVVIGEFDPNEVIKAVVSNAYNTINKLNKETINNQLYNLNF